MAELWMNSPPGYPYAEKIERNDETQIHRFLNQISGADEDSIELVKQATHEQRIKMLEDSGFTFDPEWVGVRQLPQNADGTQRSALDDPTYRRQNGIGNGMP